MPLTTFHRQEVVGLLGVLRGTSVGASTDSERNDGPGASESCNLQYQRMESIQSGFLLHNPRVH